MTAVKALALLAAGAVAAIFANFALLGVARSDEPVGKLSPRVFLTPAGAVTTGPAATEQRTTEPATTAPATTVGRTTTEDRSGTSGATTSNGPGDDHGGHGADD